MNLFGNNKKDNENTKLDSATSTPVVAEKTKDSAGFLKKSLRMIGNLLKSSPTGSKLSNTEYLGEIYKLMVVKRASEKLSREKQINRRKEDAYEEERRHKEIIKALSVRRRKPKKVRAKKPTDVGGTPNIPTGLPLPKGTPKGTPKPAPKGAEETADIAKRAAERKAVEEAEKRAAQEAEKRAVQEAEKKAAQEAERKAAQEAERKAAEEAKRKLEQEAREAEKKAAEEAKRKAEEEAKRKAAEEAKRKAEEEAKRKSAEEAKRKSEQEAKDKAKKEGEEASDAAKRKGEEEAKKRAEEQAAKDKIKKEGEEASDAAKRKGEEQAREAEKKAAEESKKRAEEEAKRKAEEEAKRKAAEEAKRKAEEEAKKRAEEEAKKRAEEEAKRKAAEEAKEAEKKAAEEAKRQKDIQDKQNKPAEETKPQNKAEQLPPGPKPKPNQTAIPIPLATGASFAAVIKFEQSINSVDEAISPVPRKKDKKGEITKGEEKRASNLEKRKGLPVGEGVPLVGAATPDFGPERSTSYGVFGLNNKSTLNKKTGKRSTSSIDRFVENNPQFGLPDPGYPGDPETVSKFNEAWWALAKRDPVGLYNAQAQEFKTNFEDIAKSDLIQEDKKLSDSHKLKGIGSDPGAQFYLTDRGIIGRSALKSALASGLKGNNIREFLMNMATYDLKNMREKIYPSTPIEQFLDSEAGLKTRFINRLKQSLLFSGLPALTGAEEAALFSIDSVDADERKKGLELIEELKIEAAKKGKKVGDLSKDNDSILKSLKDTLGKTFGFNRITNINVFQEEESALLPVDDRPAFLRKNTYG